MTADPQSPAFESELSDDERRRRRREAWLILIGLLLFVVLTWLTVARAPEGGVFGNSTFSFLLINVNLLLLILLVFLVTRNLVKLVAERRRGIFGSRLRSRLVAAFLLITLGPSVLLFFVAQGFLQAVFTSWFNVRVESALRNSVQVSQSYYQFAANGAIHFARELARGLGERWLLESRGTEIAGWLESKRAEYGLAMVGLWNQGGSPLAMAREKQMHNAPLADPAAIREALAGGEAADTMRWGRSDVVWVAVPVRDPGGAVVAALGVAYWVPRSVSELTRAIARSYAEYRQLEILRQPIKNSYILTLALITLVLIFSGTWFGIRQARRISKPLLELAAGTREVARGNWSYRIEPPGDHEIALLVEAFNQMTAELEQTNRELVQRRTYVENLLANIGAGVLSLDSTGVVTTVNPAAERLLGVAASSALGKHWGAVFAGSGWSKLQEMVAEATVEPRREIQRQMQLTSSGEGRVVLVTATPLGEGTQGRQGLMLFFEDVTHLMRVQRMEAWREVARRLAHEIKNPLTPIQLSAQRLEKRLLPLLSPEDRAIVEECTETIVQEVEHLKRLVTEFSRFARLPAVQLVPSDVNALVEDTVRMFRSGQPKLEVRFYPGSGLPLVELDRDAIKRALWNLLDNAAAAVAEEASPRVEVRTEYHPDAGAVRIEVADNGCGIPRDAKARLFEPYFSTKPEGTGLGLAIVASIAAEHQAYVHVTDNLPKGARFVLEFPLRSLKALRPSAVGA